MKVKYFYLQLLLLIGGMNVSSLAQSGQDLLQKALRKERAEGDIKGAIQLYQQIAREHASDRSLAAQALVQLGKNYEKLGGVEARNAYEKVISDFADQSKEVAEAKERLKNLGTADKIPGEDSQPILRKIASDEMGRWVAYPDADPSPDGRFLSYVNWSHGNLAICDLQTQRVRDLTTEGTWNPPDQFTFGAIWSPDSSYIAYLWMMGDDGDLRIVHRDGGPPRIVQSFKKGAVIHPQAWSRDGRHIYGVTLPKSDKNQIVKVEAATGTVTIVKEFPRPTAWVKLSLSPDGRRIVYDSPGSYQSKYLGRDPVPNELRMVNTDGSNDHVLIDHPAHEHNPRWMPDGKHLVFQSDRSGDDAIWSVEIKNADVAEQPKMIHGEGTLLGVSDDGALYYFARTPVYNIFTAEADFKSGTMGTPELASLRYDGKNRNPRWSADGTRLGYLSTRRPAVLVIQDRATGKEEDIHPLGWSFTERPLWSADLGRLVGPVRVPGTNTWGLFAVDSKTREYSVLIDRHAAWGVFTPDGNHLIYQDDRSSGQKPLFHITERNLKTGDERIIARRTEGIGYPISLSPDGSRLAHCIRPYPGKPGDTSKLIIVSMVDGSTRTAAEFPFELFTYPLDWLPDNQHILVSTTDKNGMQQMRIVDTRNRTDRPFGPGLRRDEQIEYLSVHPDGKQLAFQRGRLREEIWSMKNAFSAGKHE